MEADFAIGLAPDKADRQTAPKLTARRLVANAAVEPGAQDIELRLAHRALQPVQEPVVEQPRMVDTIRIADQRVGQAAQVDEQIPVCIVAGQSGSLQPNTRPTCPRAPSAVSRAKPDRATAPDPVRPRSSSMTTTRSAGQPSSLALCAKAYCRSVDSRLCSTWAQLDWRK